MRVPRFSALFLIIVLVLSFQSATADTGTESGWQVSDAQTLDVDGTPLAISPDGQWIAGPSPDDDFCVWNVDTLEPACDGRRLTRIIPRSVVWSPDSTAVAFSLDTPRSFVDSDVYILETSTGTLVNLTEDDPEGTRADTIGRDWDAVEVPIDLYASWSPDSQELVFARTLWGNNDFATEWGDSDPGTTLMTIPRAGGETEELHVIEPPEPMIVDGLMFWQEDGSILFGMTRADVDDEQNGIWELSSEGTPAQILPGEQNAEVPLPVIIDMTLDGSTASVVSLMNVSEMSGNADGVHFMLDINQNDIIPFEEVLGLSTIFDTGEFLAAAPVFSPNDDAIAFITYGPNGSTTVSIFSMDSGEVTELHSVEGNETNQEDFGDEAVIGWGDNTLLVTSRGGTVLITLEHGE